jgi:SNF2 family DNA or RNA helicase
MIEQSLWEHQKVGIENFKKSEGSYGFFYDVGTGKTRTAIECLRYIYNENKGILPTLIISPLITLENWKREILKYTKIQEKDIAILHGSIDKKKKILKADAKIIIMNYEGLLSEAVYYHFLDNPRAIIIGDELHYIKTHNSKRTKKVLELAEKARYRIGLTGTPVLNSSEDLWSQMYFLDSGKRLDKKFHWFKVKYFYDANAGMPSHVHFPNWQPRPGASEQLKKLISDITMSVKKGDCLDLPPFIRKEIYVDMGKDQAKAYGDMYENFVSYINDSACVANLAITKGLRLQQILSGYLPMDNETVSSFADNPRLDAAEELLSTLSPTHKIIVWAAFKQNHTDLKNLCEKLKINYVMLTGDQTKNEKDETMFRFENDPSVRVCIGNQSVGIGINLISSDISIYYSKGYNLAHDIQSEARNYRAGSERHQSVIRYDLVAKDTIDEKINEALAQKKEIGTQLLRSFSLKVK